MNTRLMVSAAAVAAGLLRFPGAFHPIRPDESGFTLVARHWDPQPDSMYGTYWVDRPPVLIGLVRFSDLVGGPYFIRVVAALGCVALVLVAAATARQALRYAGLTDERLISRTGAWTAILTAAFTTNAMIDAVQAKNELLGVPFVVTAFWLALRALNRERVDAAALALAAGAGASSVLALGMKQNIVAGLVFGGVLLLGSLLARRLSGADFTRLALAALGGAATPVLAVVGWALAVGVRLDAVSYAVYGFRSDAIDVIARTTTQATFERGTQLLAIAVATGMAFVVGGVLYHRRRVWQLDRTLMVATLAVVTVDVTALLLGGSFWRGYLFTLVPGMVLCATLLLGVRMHVARRARILVVAAMVCSMVSSATWAAIYLVGAATPTEHRSGLALAEAAHPGDTLTVYGGRADIVLSSGMTSPYEHLWSLPMRTLDPDLDQLEALLAGPDAPTWFLPWVGLRGWEGNGLPLADELRAHYELHGQVCEGRPVYLRAGLVRPALSADCD